MSDINGALGLTQNPLDVDPTLFTEKMSNRVKNRESLIEWCQKTLRKDVDFGKPRRDGKKNSLYKPGAEKILIALGLKPTFPDFSKYVEAGSSGVEIENIVLKCVIETPEGYALGEGIGGRQVSKERGDLNKALKMAKKSAMIDATLSICGFSEQYTQDLEDMEIVNNDGSAIPKVQPKKTKSSGTKIPNKSSIIDRIEAYAKSDMLGEDRYTSYMKEKLGKKKLASLNIDELTELGFGLKEEKEGL
tara:strand:+ start:1250 stop:1990 length:741 start_codon:yes stop_codon:yes gene_type:complete